LTEAQLRGEAVPPQVLAKAIAYLRNLAGTYDDKLENNRLRAYRSMC